MSEETKLAKFEVIVSEIQKWFNRGDGRMHSGFGFATIDEFPEKNFAFDFSNGKHCRPNFLDTYNSNSYIASLQRTVGTTFPSDKVSITEISEIIKIYKDAPKDSLVSADLSKRSRNQMMFWMLFMAALDDEIYNNELDSIIDIAYCMDFDEAMIRDWCHAVEYVMQGNRLREGCNFPCETLDGAAFFLHDRSSVLSLLR